MKVLRGPAGARRKNGGIHPFQKLKKDELINECHWRGLPAGDLLKKDFEANLKEHLAGVHRVPALIFHNQDKSMEESGLNLYEVAPSESLHDLKGHISNIWDELPYCLNDTEKIPFMKVKEALLTYKAKVRGVDYRLSAIVMFKHMESHSRPHIKDFLYSIAELCHLLYIQEYDRSPKIILCLHNVAYKHATLCREIIKTPHSSTMRCFYGIYWHSVITESPLVTGIISPRSLCTEEQEREFSTIKEITKRTSNGHASHIIPNSLLRIQAENLMSEKPKPIVTQHSLIGKYAETLPPSQNTIFTKDEIDCFGYQAHLERISDFLLRGEGVWWHFDDVSKCIIFHDGAEEPKSRPQGPPVHHFRSWSLKMERDYLKKAWKDCISSENLSLPTSKIKLYDAEGDFTSHKVYIADLLKEGDRPVALHVQLAATENNNFVEESEEETADHGLNKDLQEDQDDNDDIPISLAVLLNEESVTGEQLLREDQEEAPATLPVQIEKTIMNDLEAPSVQQSSNKTSCKLINTKTGKGISDKSVNENEEICQTNVTESTKSQKATNQGPVLSNCSMETHVIESTGNQKTKKQVSLLKCSISLRLQTILGDKKAFTHLTHIVNS